MRYRHLGKSGLQVSALSMGSWLTFRDKSAIDATTEMMATAYDAGVNFFDNAEQYAGGKAEEIMGMALKRLRWRRGSYLVSTKLFWGLHAGPNEQDTLNRKYLLESIKGSLRRLDLDYVDLLFCHRPDPSTPIEETVWAMHNIIERGQAIYWGTSEWSAADILAAIDIAERHHLHKPVVEQPIYNLLRQHRFGPDYRPVYEDRGYGSTVFSPLASGLLTGKYQRGIPTGSRGAQHDFDWLKSQLTNPRDLGKVAALKPLAEKMGASLAQFALAWCLQNSWVSTVLTGASHIEQVRENMRAMEFVDRFTPELMADIDRALK
ncbi:MAG: aldo/keto reductase [Gammaproteobacteria bacterium]|nr:aldo/keto reductase [Gammaproteobacteria bacterium]MDH5302856.1 aldo/keto reductase [Gammaproteobacteria bacterium]MDH5322712.1 aldo/keto reductase [Gammaproteobacteria bacterium]